MNCSRCAGLVKCECPESADSVEEVGSGVIAVAGSAVTLATVTGASPQIAEVGAGTGISIASLRRFWAVAARWNSSRAPFGPRNRSRSSFKMRLRWANSISTLLSFTPGGDIGLDGRDVARHVASALVDRARDLAGGRIRTTLRLQ